MWFLLLFSFFVVVQKKNSEGMCKKVKGSPYLMSRDTTTCESDSSTHHSAPTIGITQESEKREKSLRTHISDEVSWLERTSGLKSPPAVAVVLRDLLLMLILSGRFDARIYELVKRLAESLDVRPYSLIVVAQGYIAHDIVGTMNTGKKETTKVKMLRRLKVAGVALGKSFNGFLFLITLTAYLLKDWLVNVLDLCSGIGTATALTAGLAAPAIAAGFGTLGIMGTSSAVAFLSSVGGSGEKQD